MKSDGMSWNVMEYNGSRWNTTEFQKIQNSTSNDTFSTNELVEVEENDSSFKNAKMNNREIDIHAEEDFAFRCCRNEKIIDLLLPLLNRNKDEFYFYKEKEYYILKPLDCEMSLTGTKFEHFQVYHRKSTYLNDCIDAYQVYLRRFRKKSAFSMIYDH